MPQPRCPGCGMQQTEWLGTAGEGYTKDGESYCCQGCAEGGAARCTCRVANPGFESGDREGDAAQILMTPRDRNGRPLDPSEVDALTAAGEPVQLEGNAAPRRREAAE